MKSNFFLSLFDHYNQDTHQKKVHEVIAPPPEMFTSEGGEFMDEGIRMHEQSYHQNEESDDNFICP